MVLRKACLSALLIATVSSSASNAEVFQCTFTEPFVDTIFDTAKGVLVINEALPRKQKIVKGVSFHVVSESTFELRDVNRQPIQRLVLNQMGKDGMDEETFYPYDVHWVTRGIRGGCTSEQLKARHQKRP